MTTGNYRLVVVADEQDQVVELSEQNNTAVLQKPIHVTRGYVDLSGAFVSETLPSEVARRPAVAGFGESSGKE